MSQPTIQTLRRLRTLSQFDDSQLESLATELSIHTAAKNQRLIKRGCTDQYGFYLLSGSVVTIAKDNTRKVLESNHEGGISPIAHIRPSMYDVDALEDIEYLKISPAQLTGFAEQLGNDGESENMDVVTIEQTKEENQLTIQLFEDITSDNISLPSLPDVAQRIQQAFSQPHINADAIARIIQSDPAITAKLIMVANSALYKGHAQIDTLQQAIVRIGLEAIRKQVIIYVVKELFKATSADIRSKMQRLWQHSRRVAAFSRVLAKHSGLFDPEQAQLAGLIHDLGEIAILQYVQDDPDLYDDDVRLMGAIRNLRPQITSMLLSKWNFTEDLITVGEESENWFRNPQNEADLCDLILIAQYHSFIGSDEMSKLPPVFKLPAFAKLGLKMEEPAHIMEFVNESKAEVGIIEKLLGTV
ncbi:MAG: HDOD domain-containing protein [Gammaproteobacteria bacterium]|nr:HDOD domain-containing protein [Gammaproteobacteria bacterium]